MKLYIDFQMDRIVRSERLDIEVKRFILEYLTKNSSDTFSWVALVCQRLRDIKISKWEIKEKLKEFPPGLNSLYKKMAEPLFAMDVKARPLYMDILAVSLLAYKSLSLKELVSYLSYRSHRQQCNDEATITEDIKACGSFLTLNQDNIVSLVHQSAKDFLLKEKLGDIFPQGRADAHNAIAT